MAAITPPQLPEQANGLYIQLFGNFQVSVGPRSIQETEWTLSTAKSLIKLLALAPNRSLAKETIIYQLWPDNDDELIIDDGTEEKKIQRFHRTLFEARRTLEPTIQRGAQSAYLSLQRNGLLRLTSPGQLWIDVGAFETACDLALRTQDLTAYHTALRLYRGDLLLEDYNVEWAMGPRDRLRLLYLEILEKLAQFHLKQQEISQAISVLEQLVTSEPTREGAQRDLMRLHALCGNRYQAIHHYQRLRDAYKKYDLLLEAETEHLYKAIREGRFPAEPRSFLANEMNVVAIVTSTSPSISQTQPMEASSTNLPLRATSFIGRRRELEEIKNLLSMTRLLTLTGAGGSGKSRLAEQAAAELLSDYQHGIWLVELVALADPQLVPQTVATTLKTQQQPDKTLLETLVDALRQQNVLLLFDNCEHLLSACARLIRSLLLHCPHLRILATSRERLRLTEEKEWPVPPLTLPSLDVLPPFELLGSYDAIQLFFERARASKPTFTITAQNALTIISLCQRLDGIPLAVELAAAYVKVATVEQISTRLDNRITLLEAKTRGEITRHQTLRAVIGWSYRLLSVPEQVVFRRLSAFRGGWTLDAAEAICAGELVQKEHILELLTELAEKSLVKVEDQQEVIRYAFLEIIRQYSKEHLLTSPEAEEIAMRHLEWFTEQVEQAEPELRRLHQQQWLKRLEMEHDNLRAALRYALEQGVIELGLRLSGALWRFWYVRGHLAEGLNWLEHFLVQSQNKPEIAPQVRAKALDGAGWLAYLLGSNPQAIPQAVLWHNQALMLYREIGDTCGIAASLNALGMIAHYQGHYEQALDFHNQALTLNREARYSHGVADTLNNLGLLAKDQGEYQQAFSLLNDALSLFRSLGDERRITDMLINLSDLAYTRGNYQQVATFGIEALDRARKSGDDASISAAVQNLGMGFLYQGKQTQAFPLLEEALMLSQKLGDRWNIAACSIAFGKCAFDEGDPGRATAFAQEASALYQELTYSSGVAEAYLLQGKIWQSQGDFQQALDSFQKGAALYWEADDKPGLASVLEALAGLATLQGEPLRALHLFGAADALRERVGITIPPCDLLLYEQYVATARLPFDELEWKMHWATGKSRPIDQIVAGTQTNQKENASARGVLEPAPDETHKRPPSRRELQVIALIEQGKRDQEIAADLGCELRTVHTHVRSILFKLHLKNRAEVATWAREHRTINPPLDKM